MLIFTLTAILLFVQLPNLSLFLVINGQVLLAVNSNCLKRLIIITKKSFVNVWVRNGCCNLFILITSLYAQKKFCPLVIYIIQNRRCWRRYFSLTLNKLKPWEKWRKGSLCFKHWAVHTDLHQSLVASYAHQLAYPVPLIIYWFLWKTLQFWHFFETPSRLQYWDVPVWPRLFF